MAEKEKKFAVERAEYVAISQHNLIKSRKLTIAMLSCRPFDAAPEFVGIWSLLTTNKL